MKEEVVKPNENASVDSRKRISKVKVALTLGHSASHRAKTANSDDYTHDWSFYVRGDPGCKIYHYIDRVVFKLHESFTNPIQVIKKPPYEIHEQGYGTFILSVEVNFKNKREPRRIEYKYDLVLPADGVPPIKRCRKEILTFTNPNTEFMTKLIDGGGVLQQGNLLPSSVPKQTTQMEPPRESSVPGPSVNKNKDQPPKHSKEQEERRAAKEKRKEKKKERRAVEDEDEEDEEEDMRARKKEKKREKSSMEGEEKVEQKLIMPNDAESSQAAVKEPKKHKKSGRPPSLGTSHGSFKDNTSETKPKPEEKQKQKISSVLAAIGDVESSDDEKYFKQSPQKEPVKVHQQTEPHSSKKVLPKSIPKEKEKPKKQKQEEAFLEFDSVDALKVKKKLKTKPEKASGKVQVESDRKLTIPNKEEKVKLSKTIKSEKEAKPSKKYSSSNSDEENKPAKKTDDTFLEFDDISTLKVKKKSHEKPQIKSEYHEKSRKRQKEETPIKTKDNKKKEKFKHLKEVKLEKPRKRSASLSSDTEDDVEEDGEIRTPSSDVDIDEADEAEVARILSMEPDETGPQRAKPSKDKKNKHKAVKKDPELAWKPVVTKEESLEAPITKIKSEGSSVKFSSSPTHPDNATLKQEKTSESSTSRQSKSHSKQPEFHRAPPEPEVPKPTPQSPSSSCHIPEKPSPPLQQRYSGSSIEQEHNYISDQAYSDDMMASLRQEPSIMSPDHLRFMLNIYNKIHQLQKTDDKNTISEVVNILSSHGNSNMVIKDENVTFDLINCDLETLHSIDSVLS